MGSVVSAVSATPLGHVSQVTTNRVSKLWMHRSRKWFPGSTSTTHSRHCRKMFPETMLATKCWQHTAWLREPVAQTNGDYTELPEKVLRVYVDVEHIDMSTTSSTHGRQPVWAQMSDSGTRTAELGTLKAKVKVLKTNFFKTSCIFGSGRVKGKDFL